MSSDLIMGNPASAYDYCLKSRAPQGQEALGFRLFRGQRGLAQPIRDVLEPQQPSAQGGRRPEIKASIVARPPLPHWQVLGNALFAFQPSDRFALAAEFVDQFQGQRLS